MPRGSSAFFAARSAFANPSGRWMSTKGDDRVRPRMMRDRAAELHQHVGCCLLHFIALLELRVLFARPEEGVVRRRAVGINVREATGHAALAADALHRVTRAFDHLPMEILEVIPGDSGLEGVAHHSHRRDRVH